MAQPEVSYQQLPSLHEFLNHSLGESSSSLTHPGRCLVCSTQPCQRIRPVPIANVQTSPDGGVSQDKSIPLCPKSLPSHTLPRFDALTDRSPHCESTGFRSTRLSVPTQNPSPPPSLEQIPPPSVPAQSHFLTLTPAAACELSNFQGLSTINPSPLPAQAYSCVQFPQAQAKPITIDGLSNGGSNRHLTLFPAKEVTLVASARDPEHTDQLFVLPGNMRYNPRESSNSPTIIDREGNNPTWGITKAGKARKRLAQACLTCRAKKVKCEPRGESCLTCMVHKWNCQGYVLVSLTPSYPLIPEKRFNKLPLQAESVSSTTSTRPNILLGSIDWSSQPPNRASTGFVLTPKRDSPEKSNNPNQAALCNNSTSGFICLPAGSLQNMKRRKVDVVMPTIIENTYKCQLKHTKRPHPENVVAHRSRIVRADQGSWERDPYQIDSRATMRFLELFFAHAAHEVNMIYPQSAFTRWVEQDRDKSHQECIVLSAVLLMGSTFAEHEFPSLAKLCAERVKQACFHIDGHSSITMIQSRLLVANYYHLLGEDNLAWSFSGSAVRMISSMRLNCEEGCGKRLNDLARQDFDFTPEQWRECHRRTFWAAFLIDQYLGIRTRLLCTFQVEEIHIRLPSTEQSYEEGLSSDMPLFDPHEPPIGMQLSEKDSHTLNPVAHTITIAVLWTNATKLLSAPLSRFVDADSHSMIYESTVLEMQTNNRKWRSSLPHHLIYSRQTLVMAMQSRYAGSLVSMHTLYHICQLEIARHTRHKYLSPRTVTRHIQMARSHAFALLEIVCDLGSQTRGTIPGRSNEGEEGIAFWSSLVFRGAVVAIDTLSAGGPKRDIEQTITILEKSIASLHNFVRSSTSVESQMGRLCRRIDQIKVQVASCTKTVVVTTASRAENGEEDKEFWKIKAPMEKWFPLEQDISYGTVSKTYFSALGC
ncbi:hypothetical protein E4T45_05269 [Aureobasidium sp. EXF-8846]|nr:hypothetical protein E4T45_05269 [Aureobasidium sp. EXF-8846]